MKNIEINTTQNVIIRYELASLPDRIFAFFIDMIVIIISMIIVGFLISLFHVGESIYTLTLLPVFLFYSIVNENITNGQSIGKKALDLKIIKINGEEPKLEDFLIRWAFRSIDIYASFSTLAPLLINSTDNKQRLGDIVAGTAIVKLKPNLKIELDDILKIHSKETYEPQYPNVRKFNDEQMLLIKSTIERYQDYPNTAHKKALLLLYQKVESALALDENLKNEEKIIAFFKTLLNDYIVLTR